MVLPKNHQMNSYQINMNIDTFLKHVRPKYDMLGISKSTLSNLRRKGIRHTSIDTLVKLAESVGMICNVLIIPSKNRCETLFQFVTVDGRQTYNITQNKSVDD